MSLYTLLQTGRFVLSINNWLKLVLNIMVFFPAGDQSLDPAHKW